MALTQISTQGIKDGTITGTDLATPILIGGTSSRDVGHTHILQLEGTVTTPHSISQISNRADVHASHFDFAKSRGSGLGSNTIVQDDDFLGHILFRGADGTDVSTQSSRISAAVDGTPGSNNIPGRLEFYTQVANGSIAEKARLTSTGTFKMPDNGKISLGGAQSGSGDLEIFHDGSNSHITSGTGQFFLSSSNSNIWLRGTETGLLNTDGSEYMIRATSNGSVKLFYDNSQKFATSNNGVGVTGNVFITDSTNANNGRAVFGATSDLQIYHDGSHSRIDETGTGNLMIQSNNAVFIRKGTSEDIAKFNVDGAVELYFDNSRKLRTKTQGVEIEGELGMSDNYKIKLGTGEDLQIYHDGSNSYIQDLGTGQLRFLSNDYVFYNAGGNENIARFIENGAVELYHDNSKKFETSSTGATVTGTLAATNTNITTQMFMPDNGQIRLGDSDDLKIYHDGTRSWIKNDTGGLRLSVAGGSNRVDINKGAVDEHMARFIADGAVELYHDNSKKFETTSTGIKTTGNVAANETIVQVLHANETQGVGTGFNGLHMIGSNTNVEMTLRSKGSGDIKLQSSADEDMAIFTPDGAVELYYDNSKKFETTADGVAVTNITNNQGLDLNGVGNNTCIRFMSTGSSPGHAYRINYHSPTNNIFNSPCISFDKTDTNGTFNSHIGAISDDGFHLADNKKLHLGGTGASGDLQIVHDGSNSRISDNGTGNLILDGNNVIIQSNDNSETIAKFITNGAVELYHNNSKKFETSSEGVKHTLSNNGTIRFDQTTTANDRFQSLQYSRSGNSRGDVSQIQIGEGNISEGRINIKTSAANAGMSGGVFISNGGTSFGSMSDIRLKTKVADISDALTDIAKIDTWKYTWKSDKSNTVHLGITAQSVNEVYPEVVEQTNSLNDDEGDTTEYLAVLHQELIPVCIAAIKELKAKVEILETEVAALKAA